MRTVDLFCGCGGLSLGFQNNGYEIVGAFDFWQAAIDCYSCNFEHEAKMLDLSKKNISLKVIRPLRPEIIIGGPPCQDFSSAGERKEGERANLTVSFAKIVRNIKPKFFVMENVSRAKSSDAYAEARKMFKAAGYGLTEQVLDASKCGVPQKRKRFFCIGALKAEDGFLDEYLVENQSIISLTVREYFEQNHFDLPFDYYYRHPRTYSRRAIYSVDEPAATIRGVNRPKPPEYRPHRNDLADPELVNALTTRQRALLQTLPVDFVLPDNQAVSEQLIGNAVPVNLAAHIARALNAYINRETVHRTVEFGEWLQKKYEYKPAAVKDTISRLSRCNKLVQISGCALDEYGKKLDQNNRFMAFSKSVRSQLKRAVRLYYEYNESPHIK